MVLTLNGSKCVCCDFFTNSKKKKSYLYDTKQIGFFGKIIPSIFTYQPVFLTIMPTVIEVLMIPELTICLLSFSIQDRILYSRAF